MEDANRWFFHEGLAPAPPLSHPPGVIVLGGSSAVNSFQRARLDGAMELDLTDWLRRPLLLNGVDVRQIREYLRHPNVETTMVYTHVVKEFRNPAQSPLDMLSSLASCLAGHYPCSARG